MTTLSLTNGLFGAAAGTALEYDFSQISWTDSGSNDFEFSAGVDLLAVSATAGFTVSGDYEVSVGLTGLAHLDLGRMDTTMELDGANAIVEGDGTVGPSFDAGLIDISDFTLEATGPDAAESFIELGAQASLSLNTLITAFAEVDFVGFDPDRTETTIYDGPLDVSLEAELIPHTTLEDLGGLDGNILTVALGDYFEAKIDIPEFTYDDVEYIDVDDAPDTMVLHGESSPFATLEFGLASFLGIGPIGEELDIGILSFGFEIGLFDAKLVAEANLIQDVTMTSDLQFSMTTTLNDDVITGNMGSDVLFDTPEGEGSFEVTIDYTLVSIVHSIMSLKINTAIDWEFLLGKASIGIPVISEKWEAAFTVLSDRLDLGDLLGLSIAFELTNDTSTYSSDAGTETYTITYENFVTAASGEDMTLTTNQVEARGGDEANTMTGNGLDNDLRGGRGGDTLLGGDGDDTMVGGQGDDSMDGGAGRDTVMFAPKSNAVVVDLAANTASSTFGHDTLANIENVTGGRHGDDVTGDTGANLLRGMAGDDTLTGGDGDDTIMGGAGADVMDGGDGVDTLSYLNSKTAVTVDMGTGDLVGDDALGDSFVNFENLTGSQLADSLTGDDFANILRGADGDDSLYGGLGDDTMVGGLGYDYVDGGDGNDTADLSGASAGVNIDLSTGLGNGAAEVQGDYFIRIESIIGSAFGDTLTGDGGNNTLDGGTGADYLSGGFGNDTFIFSAGGDTYDGNFGTDAVLVTGERAEFQAVYNQGFFGSLSYWALVETATGIGAVLYNVDQVVFADQTINLSYF